jgi:cytoskeletal protein RodZ
MIINKHISTSKKVAVVVLLFVVLVLIALFILHSLGSWPFIKLSSSTNTLPITSSSSDGSNKSEVPTSTTTKTTDQVPVDTKATASITTIRQDADGKIIFSGVVNNTSDGGQCSVTFSNTNDRPYSPAPFAPSGSGSTVTCGPLSIDSQNFSYLGTWNVTLRYYVSNRQVVATGTVDITK